MAALPMVSVTRGQPWFEMGNSRNKQLVSFKLQAALSSVIKSRTFLLHPSQDVKHPFAQHFHAAYATCPQALSSHHSYKAD